MGVISGDYNHDGNFGRIPLTLIDNNHKKKVINGHIQKENGEWIIKFEKIENITSRCINCDSRCNRHLGSSMGDSQVRVENLLCTECGDRGITSVHSQNEFDSLVCLLTRAPGSSVTPSTNINNKPDNNGYDTVGVDSHECEDCDSCTGISGEKISSVCLFFGFILLLLLVFLL